MNKIYRVIWNEATRAWVAVAETAKAHGKRSSKVVLLSSALAVLSAPTFAAPPVNQLPTGGNVVAGTASIAQNAAAMTINQTTARAAIDWATFNVGSAAQVNFNQPGANSVTLNRVLDSNPSQIFGRITAPGQVFLSNPNGVYFAPGASVDVGGLVVTTHRIGLADFMAGKTTFERNGATGSVVNEGELKAALGGYIALLAPEVRNASVIVAQAGTVALAAGEAITLNFADNGTLAGVTATKSQIDALVENKHAVLAPGGLIVLSAQAANRLQGGVINNSGSLEATGLVNDGGRIILEASDTIIHTGNIDVSAAPGKVGAGGTATLIADLRNPNSRTEVNGTISARGGDLGGDGGFVETSAGRVKIGEAARVDTRAPLGKTGMWLLDPTDYTIAATGGDETGASVGNSLAISDRTIAVDDNIHVNDAVTWSANKLTLQTISGDVNINAVMTAKGTASLDLEPGSGNVNVGFNGDGSFKGRVDFFQTDGATPRSGSGFLTINGNAYSVINDAENLQAINTGDLTGNYALGSDFSLAGIANWVPIGNNSNKFTGIFDGLGHTVSNLTINRPTTDYVGLFGYGDGAVLRNVGVSGSVTGRIYIGGLLGYGNITNVSNSAFSGTVAGLQRVGGLVGDLYYGTVSASHASGVIQCGSDSCGGLVGYQYGGEIGNSYATNQIEELSGSEGSTNYLGGLVGFSKHNGQISNSYATGAVTGGDYVGGLVGYGASTTISNSYATGAVTGSYYAGGLVGYVDLVTINKSYATGAVTGSDYVGGLVGGGSFATIDESYASGKVIGGGAHVGGLLGYDSGTPDILNSYWDKETTGQENSYKHIGMDGNDWVLDGGLTTLEALDRNNYVGFDFNNTWFMVDGHTRPMLRAFLAPEVNGTHAITNLYQLQGIAADLSAKYVLANDIDASLTASTNPSDIWAGAGFAPVGNGSGGFSGSFDGLGHTISKLTINRPDTTDVGLFGLIENATVGNLRLSQPSVTGKQFVGGLVGYGSSSTISQVTINNAYVYGSSGSAGGLIGGDYGSTITNVAITASEVVGAGDTVGGLLGYGHYTEIAGGTFSGTVDGSTTWLYTGGLVGRLNDGTISESHAAGSVDGAFYVGGLVGSMQYGSIDKSYATNEVNGSGSVGGLVGYTYGASISRSFATGSVTGSGDYVGGLVGKNDSIEGQGSATISDSYASGPVTGNDYVGGLVGYGAQLALQRTYAAGLVTGAANTGGLIGGADNPTVTVDASFWDTQTTGQNASAGGGLGKTTTELRTLALFGDAGWDIVRTTSVPYGYPLLGFSVSGETATWVINDTAPTPTPTPTAPIVIPPQSGNSPLPPNGSAPGGGMAGGFSNPNPLLDVNPELVINMGGGNGGDGAGGGDGQVGPGGISISLDLAPVGGGEDMRVVTVSVPKAMATAGTGFSFELPPQVRETLGSGEIRVTLADGNPLPDWITFNPATQRFEAGAVPDGGLPLRIMVSVGDKQVLVVISERAE